LRNYCVCVYRFLNSTIPFSAREHFLILRAGFRPVNRQCVTSGCGRSVTQKDGVSDCCSARNFRAYCSYARNLKKAGAARISGPLIATTLKLLDSKWAKFEEQHERLRSRHWEELKVHEYYLQDFYGKVENAYAQQRAALLEMESSMSVQPESGLHLDTVQMYTVQMDTKFSTQNIRHC